MRDQFRDLLISFRRVCGGAIQLPLRLHRDQRGTISIVALFTLLALVILLGMVVNTGQQVDQKIKMQNAADAATYAGGVVLARNMNTLAFTNQLLSEVFALTAFMREAGLRRAESLTPEILDNWERIGRFMFTPSEFDKFRDLGLAINEKIPPGRVVEGDREMVFTFSEWAGAGSDLMLPVFEGILAEELIPQFQIALVDAAPEMVQAAVDGTARRHGRAWPNQVTLRGALWRTRADPVGGGSEGGRRTVPVVNPNPNPRGATELNMSRYERRAKSQRDKLARGYLKQWNSSVLKHFDRFGKMSQFSSLWRIFTQGELESLLDKEYPKRNLPHVLRSRLPGQEELEEDYMFVGVVYRAKRPDFMPGVFKNPVEADTIAFAQISLFTPQPRLVWAHHREREHQPPDGLSGGGIPGLRNPFPTIDPDPETPPSGESWWSVVVQSRSRHSGEWSLFNQNWSTQLTPATTEQLPRILSQRPYVLDNLDETLVRGLPRLGELDIEDIRWINHH
ncbi:MAG: Tad domain-containing protein [Planctomycetota bacterium]